MITVKKLKEELNKFKDTDTVFAYEGEGIIGLIINREESKKQGIIFCGEVEERNINTVLIEDD